MNQKVITINEAQAIAEQAIAEILGNAEELRGYSFGPVKFRRENKRFRVFSSASEQLIEEGYVPGAIYACVDKVDGHVWSTEEQEQYAREVSQTEPSMQPDYVTA